MQVKIFFSEDILKTQFIIWLCVSTIWFFNFRWYGEGHTLSEGFMFGFNRWELNKGMQGHFLKWARGSV